MVGKIKITHGGGWHPDNPRMKDPTLEPEYKHGTPEDCYRYAKELFGAWCPQCEPLDDLYGVLMQIDNYVTGLHSGALPIKDQTGWKSRHADIKLVK